MTASELFQAIAGLPTEATCGTIFYKNDLWFSATERNDNGGFEFVSTDHAEALQRDALAEYLHRADHNALMPEFLHDDVDGLHWSIDTNVMSGCYPSRTLALIAAVRHVAGEGKV